MFTNQFRGFLANHGRTWERNEYNDDIMWMVIACTLAHLLTGTQSSAMWRERISICLCASGVNESGWRPVVEDS